MNPSPAAMATPVAAPTAGPSTSKPNRRSTWLACGVLALLLISNGPLFLCMPLTNDVAMYDLQAWTLREGGVLYRDILEPNLPGVVWMHAAIRSLLGPRSEAMRLADLVLFSATVCLLAGLARARGSTRVWLAVILFFFYFSISEWSHCQRDVWMLPPALGGLMLRRRQIRRLAATDAVLQRGLGWALLEGLCWGMAVWIKPFVMVPALSCWLVSALHIRHVKLVGIDLLGLLAGGLLVGGAGMGWLHWSGAWPHFVETLRDWNPHYFAAGKEHWTAPRFVAMTTRLFPWIFLHLVAVPMATAWLVRDIASAIRTRGQRPFVERSPSCLFAIFYLGWLLQSFFLQHLFDYVHIPGILLAIGLLTARALENRRPIPKPALIAFVLLAVIASPAMRSDRLSCWRACITEGSTPAIRNHLAHTPYPDWEDLERVADFLGGLDLRDGQLCCYNNHLVYLYQNLRLHPPTRFVYLEALLVFFPDHRREIMAAVRNSAQRYVVADLISTGMSREEAGAEHPDDSLSLPAAFPPQARNAYPWRYPVVFRSGTLVVHAVPAVGEQPKTTRLSVEDSL